MDIVRFGTFEVHLPTAELYKQGRLIRLQQQPFEVLRELLEHPGDLVSREMLRKRLWPDGVTVGFDQSLNKCVTKLRDALGDTATNPRFVETLPKRGYRFIAPLSRGSASEATAPPATSSADAVQAKVKPAIPASPDGASPADHPGPRPEPRSRPGLAAWAGLTATLAAVAVWLSAAPVTPHPTAAAPPDAAPSTASPIFAARDAFSRGREALGRHSDESLRASARQFERAIALSPRFAEAYVGVATSLSLLTGRGLADPRETMPRSRDSANRALMLDPGLGRAHAVLARTTMLFDLDWKTAEWHFTRATALGPGDAATHEWFSEFWSALGERERAVAEASRAVAAEPTSLTAGTALGTALYRAGALEAAGAQLERTLEIDPDFAPARRVLSFVRAQQGRLAEACTGLERVAILSGGSAPARAELAWAHAVTGRSETARRILATVASDGRSPYVPPDTVALVHAALGEVDRAFDGLARAVTERAAGVAFLAVDARWDPFRDDPRLRRLVGLVRPER